MVVRVAKIVQLLYMKQVLCFYMIVSFINCILLIDLVIWYTLYFLRLMCGVCTTYFAVWITCLFIIYEI